MNKKLKNIGKYKIGTKINFLTIQNFTQTKTPKKVLCLCDCGNLKEFYLSNIIPKPNSRYTKSCGCKKSDLVSQKTSTHGMTKTKFYKRWRSMFDRCSPKYICAKDYVNIKVCKKWHNFIKFKNDMYGKYLEHKKIHGERQTTLDRVNPFLGYSPENCRWATFSEQNYNTKKQWLKLNKK